jgi:hypothetical protein
MRVYHAHSATNTRSQLHDIIRLMYRRNSIISEEAPGYPVPAVCVLPCTLRLESILVWLD